MDRSEAGVNLVGMAATTIVATPFIKVFEAYMSLPVLGVPVSVPMAALFGAGLSLFFGDPVTPRRNLWGQVLAATAFGASVSVMAAEAFELKWAQDHETMSALMVAALIRWFLPTIIERGKLLINNFSFSWFKKSKDGEGK